MTVLYVMAGVIVLALLIYLFVAMLRPEAFE
jgi:K+-transporting ATPase KdpF subunit